MKGIQGQIQSMKSELSDERSCIECLVKKMRMDKGVQFKRKGNDKQHQFTRLIEVV